MAEVDFTLKPNEGSRKKRKRVGRGAGSGMGKTSTRGQKGQRSRSGGKGAPYVGFEGGQMPIYRRLPKRGFTNIFKKDIAIVNLDRLEVFSDGEEVNIDSLKAKGLVRKNSKMIKLLSRGEISKKLSVKLHYISDTAKEKLEKAGGSFESIAKVEEPGNKFKKKAK